VRGATIPSCSKHRHADGNADAYISEAIGRDLRAQEGVQQEGRGVPKIAWGVARGFEGDQICSGGGVPEGGEWGPGRRGGGMGDRMMRQPKTRKARGREGSRECEPLASKTKPCTEHHLTAQAASPSKKRELEIQQHTCSNRMSQLSKKPAEGSM
jgi:hypothetical protein